MSLFKKIIFFFELTAVVYGMENAPQIACV